MEDNIPAIVESWEPGSFGGQAIAEIIFGDINPSGKLPVTFPRSVGQIQMVYNHKPSQYFKKYGFEQTVPLYPFGFGLSYSKFEYSNLQCEVVDQENINVIFEVKNNSNIDGEEVVQLYFNDNISSVTRPVKELVDYRRVFIKSGETKTCVFNIPIKKLMFYDINMIRCVEKGSFTIMVGGSSSEQDLISTDIYISEKYKYCKIQIIFS